MLMKEMVYGGLVLVLALLMGLYFSYMYPETTTFVTIITGSVVAAVGTYIASYRAQKYLQDRSEKRVYVKTIFYPVYRELESNMEKLKSVKKEELSTNIWVYTINSPEFLGLERGLRTGLEKLYERIKGYNSLLKSPGKELVERERLKKEISKMMKTLEAKMKEK